MARVTMARIIRTTIFMDYEGDSMVHAVLTSPSKSLLTTQPTFQQE